MSTNLYCHDNHIAVTWYFKPHNIKVHILQYVDNINNELKVTNTLADKEFNLV